MPEEVQEAPAVEQDQPDSAPQEGTSASEVAFTDVNLEETPDEITQDWLQDRYQQMQRDYTQKTQALAEERRAFEEVGFDSRWLDAYRDPDTREEALEALLAAHGIELEDDEEDSEDYEDDDYDEEDYEDEDDRVDQLEQRVDEREMQELIGALEDHIEELAEGKEVELSDRQRQALLREAIEAGPDEKATERVFSDWYEERDGWSKQAVEAYRKTKQAPPPPQSSGQSGSPEVPIADEKARRQRMQEIADQAYASSS